MKMSSSAKVINVGRLILLGLLAHLAAASDPEMTAAGALMCHADGASFSYHHGSVDGPHEWYKISACCGGSRQSPRNILSVAPFTLCNTNLPSALAYTGSTKVTGLLYNKGHDPVLDFTGYTQASLKTAPYASGLYSLSNIHIHFHTAAGAHGSEHAIDYQYYAAEAHMVHYKTEYGSVAEAVVHEDGLLVVGLMLEITTGVPDAEIVKLINGIQAVVGVGSAGGVPIQIDVSALLPKTQGYYTYAGSLTTPPCSETVRWVVMKQSLKINQLQMDILAGMISSEGGLISDFSNHRPVQVGDTQVETNSCV